MPGGNETILVAEDEVSVRRATVRILRRLGYTVLEANNGDEALTRVHNDSQDIHLLLTDVVMPCMNGKELADCIKVVRPHVRILFMSGYTDNTIMDACDLLEGIQFLPKPFSEMVLAQKIREILSAGP